MVSRGILTIPVVSIFLQPLQEGGKIKNVWFSRIASGGKFAG
jgi:hypothetical protein